MTLKLTLKVLEGSIACAPAIALTFVGHRSNVEDCDYERWEPRVEVGIAALTLLPTSSGW